MRRPKWLIITKNIWHNYAHRMRLTFGHIDTEHGATHMGWTVNKSLAYIDTVYSDYLRYAGLDETSLQHKTVLEIGPGDNLGVALKFLAAGAGQVVCLDRFRAKRDRKQEYAIYDRLRETLDDNARRRFDKAIDLEHQTINPEKLTVMYGVSIEDADSVLPTAHFDLIVSRAVLMEIEHTDRAFTVMDRLLRNGGYSIHKVAPLHDYRMFRNHGYHPLEFLTVPDALYRRMVSDSGKPNRRLMSHYREQFVSRSYATSVQCVRLLGSVEPLPPGITDIGMAARESERAQQLLSEIRPRLPERYKKAAAEDLIVEDIFVVAKKQNRAVCP